MDFQVCVTIFRHLLCVFCFELHSFLYSRYMFDELSVSIYGLNLGEYLQSLCFHMIVQYNLCYDM